MKHFLLIVLMLALTACASVVDTTKSVGKSLEASVIEMMTYSDEDESSPPRALEEIKKEVLLTTVWQREVPSDKAQRFSKLNMVLSDGTLYVANHQGKVLALDQTSGDTSWEVQTGLPISGGLSLGYENLFFATSDADVVALKLNNGDTSWTTQVSSEVLSVPRFSDGSLVVRSIDGAINTLDTTTGQEIWSYIRDVPALSLRGTSSPVIKSGGVISGYANGKLVVLRLKDGMQIWETSVAVPRGRGALSRMVDVDSDPLAGERFIYAATYNGGIAAVDIRSGQIAWRRSELSSYKSMAADWVSLFVVDVNNHIWSADQTNGSINWQQDDLENRRLTAPVRMNQYLLMGDYEGYLHVLSASDGRLLGRLKVSESAITSAPIVDDELIYLKDSKGVITALRLTDIKE